MQPYVAQVMIFGFNFPPRSWAFCNGALLSITQNQALFSLIGTTYGGDGRLNFALPNIQDGAVMAQGQGPGTSSYALGQKSGVSDVTLLPANLPTHTHTVSGLADPTATDFKMAPAQGDWIGNRVGGPPADVLFATAPAAGQAFAPQTITFTGGSLPHANEQPYLCMNYCIALSGIFPSRN
jgi:microcystin-dependent protein